MGHTINIISDDTASHPTWIDHRVWNTPTDPTKIPPKELKFEQHVHFNKMYDICNVTGFAEA